MIRCALPVVCVLLLGSSAPAQVGSVARAARIGNHSGLTGEPKIGDFFGGGLAPLGDLNGDGVGDLAVGASGASTIWTLFLRADGSLAGFNRFSLGTGVSWFGRRLAAVGDLDGDGHTELATSDTTGLFILFLQRNGSLRTLTRILYADPLFVPPISSTHMDSITDKIRLGGLCALGDLDGDGVGDVAVGAPGDFDGSPTFTEVGAVWILRLNADGTLKAAQKISQLHGGFTGTLGTADRFGHALTLLGDLDSDGNPELGVGSLEGHQFSDKPFWVISLAPDGTVLRQTDHGSDDYSQSFREYGTLGDLDGDGITEVAMGPIFAVGFTRVDGSVRKRLIRNYRAEAFARLGDLDGDGLQEVAVGSPQEDGRGAVHILSLARDALRNGSGVNPLTLTQASEPVFGAPWTATLDCSGHASGVAALWGFDRPTAGIFTLYGEVLVTGNRVFQLVRQHSSGPVSFTNTLPPPRIGLIDLEIYIQGACSGAPGARFSNGLGVVIGEP